MGTSSADVDRYLAAFPDEVRAVLEQVRAALHAGVSAAEEKISYQIPTLTAGGRSVVSFAGWKKHVSVYPAPVGDAAYEEAVAPYRAARSTLKFPLDAPIPYDLLTQTARLLAARS